MKHMGKLIVVSGRSGAGKTTLISFALKELSNLSYLTTYTTRKERGGDIGYKFLTHEQYLEKMRNSVNWDNTEVHDNFYGADVAEAIEILSSGESLIVTSYPDLKELNNFKMKYPCDIISIFIDISESESKKRLQRERPNHEILRVKLETESISAETIKGFDIKFTPEGFIQNDIAQFNKMLENLLK